MTPEGCIIAHFVTPVTPYQLPAPHPPHFCRQAAFRLPMSHMQTSLSNGGRLRLETARRFEQTKTIRRLCCPCTLVGMAACFMSLSF